ncbi:MAG: DNA polymerase III subunit gamma/tau [Clostridia bacterium]|nr:DNA polymerase III subunit gamma/tau [Clostridia bacterium]
MADSYQALYRKWRPMTFDDVVGQKHVSDTLKTGIATGRIAHAYLFCGTRGTGKTSTAKIFSRAVNCENPQNGEPCNECPTCRGILDGSILDVYEMDAASNRGVENIREIRDEVIYTPAGCTYKVYIIDEVHMLTAEAFNALLKTLEEPPKHALFILATTEPHKIPATVLSRCQRFDFRRIGVDDIAGRLSQIAKAEGIGATPDALELVAELGDGSMRDALSLLDQCAAFGYEELTTGLVTEIVGIADPKTLFAVADAVAEGNTKEALLQTDGFLRQGKEVQNFLEELTLHFRSLLICKTADDPAELLERTPEAAARFQTQAERFSVEQILYMIGVLSECLAQAKWMATPQVAAEVAMVKLCNPAYSTEPSALLARLEKLERMLAQGVTAVPAESPSSVTSGDTFSQGRRPTSNPAEDGDTPPWNVPAEEAASAAETTPTESPSSVTSGDTFPSGGRLASNATGQEEVWEFWADALQEVKNESKLLYAFMSNAKGILNGSTVEIELSNQVAFNKIATPQGLEYLSKLFSRISGQNLRAEAFLAGERKKQEEKASIFDLAQKKDLLGDKLHIIQNQE